jgi:hypothetical protein
MGEVAERELGPNHEFSYERYFDIAVFDGKWWEGKRRALLVCEVENDWAELRGTLRDLLNAQSLMKWGVFYHGNLESAKDELVKALAAVRQDFDDAGFLESKTAKYEIIVFPERLGDAGLLGAQVVIATCESDRMFADVSAELAVI